MLPTSSRGVVHHVQRPRAVRRADVERGQCHAPARRRRRSRERITRLVVRRLITPTRQLRPIRKHDRGLVVDRQITVDDIERAARIGHEDRVLATRRHQQHVDVIRIRVTQTIDLHIHIGDRATQPRNNTGRRIGGRRPSIVDRDRPAADDPFGRLGRSGDGCARGEPWWPPSSCRLQPGLRGLDRRARSRSPERKPALLVGPAGAQSSSPLPHALVTGRSYNVERASSSRGGEIAGRPLWAGAPIASHWALPSAPADDELDREVPPLERAGPR